MQHFPHTLRNQVQVIPLAVAEKRLEPTKTPEKARSAFGFPEDAPVVGCWGILSPDQNALLAVEAASLLPQDWRLVPGASPGSLSSECGRGVFRILNTRLPAGLT
ncbi:MAG: hypothetical protein D6743_04285 [Calditrichaeota bacterium]|nr:MAG: hypothetical protein D6743_04285 [Calditrichota bacterium]